MQQPTKVSNKFSGRNNSVQQHKNSIPNTLQSPSQHLAANIYNGTLGNEQGKGNPGFASAQHRQGNNGSASPGNALPNSASGGQNIMNAGEKKLHHKRQQSQHASSSSQQQQINAINSPKFNNQFLRQRASAGGATGATGLEQLSPHENQFMQSATIGDKPMGKQGLQHLASRNLSRQGYGTANGQGINISSDLQQFGQNAMGNSRQQRLYNQTLDPVNGPKGNHQNQMRGGSSGPSGAGGMQMGQDTYQMVHSMIPNNGLKGNLNNQQNQQNYNYETQQSKPLYTLTNTTLTQNKYGGRAQSDLRGGGGMGMGLSAGGDGSGLSYPGSRGMGAMGSNSLNGQLNNTLKDGLNNKHIGPQNNSFKQHQKRSQSVERGSTIHSSGNQGLNSLRSGSGAAALGGLDAFSSGLNSTGLGSGKNNNQLNNQYNGSIGSHDQVGSVQNQRKRRQIMHDSLTNSRGNSRIQNHGGASQYDYEMQNLSSFAPSHGGVRQPGNGIGMQSPPSLPGPNHVSAMRQNAFQKQQEMSFSNQNSGADGLPGMNGGQQMSHGNQPKHFMQDAIERKIEKFSSQNINVQKRVNTSSKFRNNNHMMMGSLNNSQVSAQHGPGTSGGQGSSSSGLGALSKKKYSINGQNDSPNQSGLLNDSMTNGPSGQGGLIPPTAMKNQQMKRPNTIANKHNTGQKIQSNTQQFDINGIKLNKEKEVMSSGYGNDRQVSQNNMSEIYDMLEKQQHNQNQANNQHQQKQGSGTPVISKDSITFTNSKHIHSLQTSPPNSQVQGHFQNNHANTSNKKNAAKSLQNKFQMQMANQNNQQLHHGGAGGPIQNANQQNQNHPAGPPSMQARNLQKNLAKVKLNKIYDNKFFQNPNDSTRQQPGPGTPQPQQIQGQGNQGSQGSQGGQSQQQSNQKQRHIQLDQDDELGNTSRMHISVQHYDSSHSKRRNPQHHDGDEMDHNQRHGSQYRHSSNKRSSKNPNDGPNGHNGTLKANLNNASSLSFSPEPNSAKMNMIKTQKLRGQKSSALNKYDSEEDLTATNIDDYQGNPLQNSDAENQFTKHKHRNKTNTMSQRSSSVKNNNCDQSSWSYDSNEQKSTKKEMVRFLSRILDRNKPLFVFNTRVNNDDDNGAGTPSFSMITLIQEND